MISLMAEETVICTYRVRSECEERFLALLARHWRTLHELGFVTDEEPLAFRGTEDGLTFVEVFSWVEGGFGPLTSIPTSSRSGSRWNPCWKNAAAVPAGSSRTSSR
jgi:hypothetical protein